MADCELDEARKMDGSDAAAAAAVGSLLPSLLILLDTPMDDEVVATGTVASSPTTPSFHASS